MCLFSKIPSYLVAHILSFNDFQNYHLFASKRFVWSYSSHIKSRTASARTKAFTHSKSRQKCCFSFIIRKHARLTNRTADCITFCAGVNRLFFQACLNSGVLTHLKIREKKAKILASFLKCLQNDSISRHRKIEKIDISLSGNDGDFQKFMTFIYKQNDVCLFFLITFLQNVLMNDYNI